MRWIVLAIAGLLGAGLIAFGIRKRRAQQVAAGADAAAMQDPLVSIAVFTSRPGRTAGDALRGAPAFDTSRRIERLSAIASHYASHRVVNGKVIVTKMSRGASFEGAPIIRDGRWEVGTTGGGQLGTTLDAVIVVASAVGTAVAGPEAGAAIGAGGAALRGAAL